MAILKLHVVLLKKPLPITEDCDDDMWKYFKNCLCALDGTIINVTVPSEDRSKYRTRKGTIAMNILGVCSPDMEFIYVLPGWEGLAHDGRVLRDAISRPGGLKVPRGSYYLCDAGYTNGEGFLAPYRGHLYHLSEWTNGTRQPQSAEECFNLRHAQARNFTERCFGVMKGRWGILRSPSWFSLRTHGRIVMACCLLHNLIGKYMPPGSIFEDLSEDEDSDSDEGDDGEDGEVEINENVPTGGLKAVPQIDSRLKTLVGKYRAILQMLGTSGFKWDDERHMISVERSVHDEYCKYHPACKKLFGVSFPHFNVMTEIYGKDYATGRPAEGFEDPVRNMEKEKIIQVDIDSSDDDGDETQSIQSAPPLKKAKIDKASKKRKVQRGLRVLAALNWQACNIL
ncbi:hypothetical protein OROMI_012700 [Orobanche minor]